MPVLRKLNEDEVTALENKQARVSSRVVTAQVYDALLADYNSDDYGELQLDEADKKPTVKANVAKAFARRNLGVQWRRGKANSLKFHVTAGE